MQNLKTIEAVHTHTHTHTHTIQFNKINKEANEVAFTFNTEKIDYISKDIVYFLIC